MATATGNYVHDNSSFANFANWATAIDAALLAFGWKQSPDTGQVMWLGVSSFSAVTNVSGTTWRYAYSGLTGSGSITAFAVGMVVTITGFTGGAVGNNGTFVITAVGSGTFDVVNASGTTSISGSGVITKQTTVPSSAYVYSIWVAQDSQASTLPIYKKIEYGFSSTVVRIRETVGTASNGSGTVTGQVCSGTPWQLTAAEGNNGATTYPCYFSGDAGEFRAYMWQTNSNNNGVVFGIERSKDSSGAKTTDYVTVYTANAQGPSNSFCQGFSSSAVGVGLSTYGCWPSATAAVNTGNTGSSTASYPVFTLAVPTAELGNVALGFVGFVPGDVTDGALVTVSSLYGGTHTFVVAAKNSFSSGASPILGSNKTFAIGMRYE